MERTLPWIRDNPQFAALSFTAVVLAIVMTVLALTMRKTGMSLRPVVWFIGFFVIVAGPQAVVHFLDGVVLRRDRETRPAQAANSIGNDAPSSARAPVPWEVVFGPKADPALITDAKAGLSAILANAQDARLSFSVDGSSALAARFNSATAAALALDKYGTFFAFAEPRGSDDTGWTARRHGGQGEWVHVVTAGPELYAWTAADRELVLAKRARALGPVTGIVAGPDQSAPGLPLVSRRLVAHPGLMVSIMSLNLVAAGWWFFKGSAWAARVERTQLALPSSAQMLRSDLVAINRRNVPTAVKHNPDDTIEIEWRYADARWFDLMRLHRIKRIHRLVLILDEPSHTVRAREYGSAFDASANARTLRLEWKAVTGIQFFALEHQRVFGAGLGADGKPTGELNQSYTFNLQELKRPVIEAVTRAGWHWQPVVWNAPASLRWLTE
jgi:hypothetical protein